MRARAAAWIATGLLALAPAVAHATDPPVRVYGLELEKRGRTERLLIFAEGELAPQLAVQDAETIVLTLSGAVLDDSAPTRIVPRVGKAVSQVLAFAPADTEQPEVRVIVQRRPGLEPTLSQRGSIVALEFARPRGGDVTLDFHETEIAEIVRDIAEVTGLQFVFDDGLKGRVTIRIAEQVDAQAALEVLGAALALEGFAVVETPGGALRILPSDRMPGRAPWLPDGTADAEAPVTTLVSLDAADPVAVVAALQPRLAGGGVALPYAPTNGVILAGPQVVVTRWTRLARALDVAARRELQVVPIREAAAAQVAELLRTMAERKPGAASSPVSIWADPRSNRIVLRGTAERLEELRAWIARLDVPAPGEGDLQVIRLHHADPERVAALPVAPESESAARPLRIAVDGPTRSLVVAGDAEMRSRLGDLVEAVDLEPPQISLEITVMEVSMNGRQELSFDAFLPINNNRNGTSTNGVITLNPDGQGFRSVGSDNFVARVSKEPLLIPVTGPDGNETTILVPRRTAVVTANGREVRTRLLSRPHLLMTSGEEHSLFAGNNVPILVSRTDQNRVFDSANDVQRQDVGVDLRVTPSAGQAGGVKLDLRIEISDVIPSDAGDVQQVGVSLRQRQLDTSLTLQDGQVVVIGAQEQPTYRSRVRGTPWLRRFPIVGAYFRKTQEERFDNYLLITAQAWIHRNAAGRVAGSIQRRTAFERSIARLDERYDLAEAEFAVRVASTDSRASAERIAADLDGEIEITPWTWDGQLRFDVHLVGYRSMAAAAAAANRLPQGAWRPRVVTLSPTRHRE